MLKFLQIKFSIITAALAGYALITLDFKYQSYMSLFLGLTMLVIGIRELKKNKKSIGWLAIGLFVFSLFLFIQRLILF